MRVRTVTADSLAPRSRRIARDLDYLAARLHGRRSRMAEGARLDSLCRMRSLPEFFHALFPDAELKEASDFQRLTIDNMVREISGFPAHMPGPGADFLDWILIRYQLENLKVWIRVLLTNTPATGIEQYLISIPGKPTLHVRGPSAAESLRDLVHLVPRGLLRDSLRRSLATYGDQAPPFFFETDLDRSYLEGLLESLERLPQEDREIIEPLVRQEVDIFHLMLVVRGRFHYALTPEILLPLHISGTRISHALFAAMLGDPDLPTAVGRAVGRALDTAPPGCASADASMTDTVDSGVVERLGWKRYLRLANLAFRRSHMGLGAVIGYVGLRRMETADLITISEGIQKGVASETIRARLITSTDSEAAYV